MMRGLLIQERIILEALYKGKQTLNHLQLELQLSKDFLLSVLSHLIIEGVISYKNGYYFIHRDSCLTWLEKRAAHEYRHQEIRDLIRVGLEETEELIFRKVWLGEDDRIILDRLIQDLRKFLNYLAARKLAGDKHYLYEQSMVLLMLGSYGDAIQALEREVA